uniref:Site-specific recombinase n=1 Tax=Candidatus Nitrotoga fabula TaxID=2182327 RepID=A0A2X0QSY7_9PROT|nr:Site-specific recombinase [Candidatus Nitrotoga fabula]
MKSFPATKQVGIWIRVSTEDQVRGESPETHERRARLYAEAKGWDVVEVYRLDAVSGKTVKDTPEAKQMLSDMREGRITGLIFSKLARLARNTKELLEFSEIFREHGADLISLAESIDTSTPAGRLFYTMIAAMAQWEREEISERVAAAVPIRAKAGKPTGGQAPFGYQWKNKELLIDPIEAPVRKLMYELFRDHKRKKVVARLLNEQGHRTRNGGKFTDTTVDRLLRDTIAKGTRRANYTRNQEGGKGSWALKPESEWVHLEVDPIVSEELWNECNHYLDAQRSKHKRPAKPAVHLFSGLAYCACGPKMYVPSNSPKYTCQKCRNKMPLDDLEAVFHEQVKNFLISDQEIMTHLEQANEEVAKKSELLSVLEKEVIKLAHETDKLYELYQSGMIDKSGFGTKYKPIAERRDQLENQIPELQAEIDILKITHLSQEVAIEEARDVHSRWPTLSYEEKRRIVEAIVERITIGDGEIDISLYYTPPLSPTSSGDDSKSNQGGSIPPCTSSGNRGKLATSLQGFMAASS